MLLVLFSLQIVDDISLDFEKTINKGFPTLVQFFAEWCVHCRQLESVYQDLGQMLATSEFLIAKVDCTLKQNLCRSQGIVGYPTLLFYNNGMLVDQYQGPRNAEDMKQWLYQKIDE